MTKFVLLVVLFASTVLFTGSTYQKTYRPGSVLTLQPGSDEGIDAYIEEWPWQNYSNTNWGDHPMLSAMAWTGQGDPLTVRCLLKFDLTSIPKTTVIKKASLALYAVSEDGFWSGHSTMNGPNDFMLAKVVSPWDEHTVTWNTQPRISVQHALVLPPSSHETQNYTDIDITELVQEMIAKPTQNHGVMIRLWNETYYRRVVFASSDHADSHKRPKLVIEF
jgi:hypothetical protein